MPGFVDLFAGCGGLSLGLHRAGFRHVLAVEKSPMAGQTYYHNFISRLSPGEAGDEEWKGYLSLTLAEQAARGLVVAEVGSVLSDGDLMRRLQERDLDLVAGGPPCQGFSMAGRRDPNDSRNQLAWQFLEFVEATSPRAVIIENVLGIGQDFVKRGARAPLEELTTALSQMGRGYVVRPMRLNAMDFGVPQHRPRVFIVGLRSDIVSGRSGVLPWWSSRDLQEQLQQPCKVSTTFVRLTVHDALWDLVDDSNGRLVYKVKPGDEAYDACRGGAYAGTMRSDPGWLPPSLPEAPPPELPLNGTQRRHSPPIVRRFQLYQYLDRAQVRPGLLNVAADPSLTPQEREEAVRSVLKSAPLPAETRGGVVLAKTLDELVGLVLQAGTKKHSQRPLRWDEPAPTVMSLPDDFVHPEFPRTLTVREMARLQSFPDHFEFRSKETTGSDRRRYEVPQYTQVGNAVPPLVAEAVGKFLYDALRDPGRALAAIEGDLRREPKQAQLRI
jgi:DNA (cytosine-5)-methyltransferase 1